MVNLENPFTYENSENPWIMDSKDDKDVIVIEDHKITAKYLWSLNIDERKDILNKVFNYYREHGFPYETYSEEYCVKQFRKLIKYDSNNVITKEGYISNYGVLCLDLCRHFCKDYFWKASNEDMLSIEDAFNNDEVFIKVLKNRMGWNGTKEGALSDELRPYMFEISDKIIRNGIRNSGLGYGVSNFRPAIMKYIYEHYLNIEEHPIVFDYSAGWGARAMAAASLNIDYYGVDPLTYDCINDISDFLKNNNLSTSNITCYNSGSENTETYRNIHKVDMCASCPPYFKLEKYSNENTQSYNEFDEFEDWINEYWKPTVENCKSITKDNGYFVLIIKDSYKKYPLKDSMENVILDNGYELVDMYQYKTSQTHLTGKAKTGKVTKNSEYVLVYRLK